MRILLSLFVAAISIGPTLATAQETPEQLTSRIEAIENKIDEMVANHNAILANERDLRQRADERDERLQGLQLRVDALIANDEKMITSLESLSQRIGELNDKVDQITSSGGGNASGLGMLSREGLAENKEGFFGATNGQLEVYNQMGDWRKVHVNGNEWRFPPGRSTITIPFGPVHAKLLGGERFQFTHEHWQSTPDGHVLRMEITNQIPQPGFN